MYIPSCCIALTSRRRPGSARHQCKRRPCTSKRCSAPVSSRAPLAYASRPHRAVNRRHHLALGVERNLAHLRIAGRSRAMSSRPVGPHVQRCVDRIAENLVLQVIIVVASLHSTPAATTLDPLIAHTALRHRHELSTCKKALHRHCILRERPVLSCRWYRLSERFDHGQRRTTAGALPCGAHPAPGRRSAQWAGSRGWWPRPG